MLKITNDGRCIALDPKVYIPEAESGNKIKMCANNIYKIWKQSSDRTQIVFCDLSTPSVGNKAKVRKEYCVYDDLKNNLTSLGIPDDEIQFIQNFNSSSAKEKLFNKVKKGDVRVLIGSTQMMGTGTNVQDKLIALHHLDCPYRPADIEQREGRIIRQGNTNPTVKIFNYVTKGTFDAFMYQMVERKQRFISSIMTSKNISNRSAEDVDEATLNYGQIKAVASDNPIVLRKFEIDSEVTKLASIRNDFIENHRALEDEVEITLPNRIHSLEVSAENYRADIEFAKSHKLDGDNFTVEIQGKNYNKRTSAVEALYASAKNIADNDIVDIGSYRGFRLLAYKEIVGNYFNLCLTVKNRLGYRLKLNPTAGIGNMIKLNNLLNVGIAERLKDTETTIIDLKHRLETAKEEIKREFPQENDYQQLLREQAKINAQLTVADNQNNGISPDGSQPSEINSSSYKPKIRR